MDLEPDFVQWLYGQPELRWIIMDYYHRELIMLLQVRILQLRVGK